MDAVYRFVGRAWAGAVVAAGVVGCATADGPPAAAPGRPLTPPAADRPAAANSVARPQAPDAPPVQPPAPVVPLDAPDVQQAAALAEAEQAAPQVRVAAVVGLDNVITDDEVWQNVRQVAPAYARLTGEARAAKEKELYRAALRRLIERELILNDFFTKLKKNKPGMIEELKDEAAKTAAQNIKDIRKQNKFGTEEEFIKVLRGQGMSYKVFQRDFERNAMMQMYVGQIMKEEVNPGRITQVQIRRFYDEHPDEFQTDDRVKWLDLFIAYNKFATPRDAAAYMDGLVKQLRAGADFVELTKQHGHGFSAVIGAGYGEKRGELQPAELEPAVWAAAQGVVGDPIPTATGLHVIKVVERQTAGVRPFDDKVQGAIRRKLANEAQKVRFDRLIDDLWRQTSVRVVENP